MEATVPCLWLLSSLGPQKPGYMEIHFPEGLLGTRRGEVGETCRCSSLMLLLQQFDDSQFDDSQHARMRPLLKIQTTTQDVSMQAVEGMRKMQATENGPGSGKQEAASMSDAKSAEIVGTILEHLNPEIASLRETVHLLQQRVAEPAVGDGGDEEDDEHSEQGGPVFVQLAKLWAAVGDSPSAARFDALAAQADMMQEQVPDSVLHP